MGQKHAGLRQFLLLSDGRAATQMILQESTLYIRMQTFHRKITLQDLFPAMPDISDISGRRLAIKAR
jgi:hypothetical protein